MSKPKIHYSGEGIGGMLPGWPVCGSGDFAFSVVAVGNHSTEKTEITCSKCIKKMRQFGLFDTKKTVTVCDACLCASCWNGEVYCQHYKTAGKTEKTIDELRKLNLEHEDWFNPPKKLVTNCE